MTFDTIKKLTEKDGKTLEQIMIKLHEEGGELSECILAMVGARGHKSLGVSDLVDELADVIITAISLACKAGIDGDQLLAACEKKLERWEKRLCE